MKTITVFVMFCASLLAQTDTTATTCNVTNGRVLLPPGEVLAQIRAVGRVCPQFEGQNMANFLSALEMTGIGERIIMVEEFRNPRQRFYLPLNAKSDPIGSASLLKQEGRIFTAAAKAPANVKVATQIVTATTARPAPGVSSEVNSLRAELSRLNADLSDTRSKLESVTSELEEAKKGKGSVIIYPPANMFFRPVVIYPFPKEDGVHWVLLLLAIGQLPLTFWLLVSKARERNYKLEIPALPSLSFSFLRLVGSGFSLPDFRGFFSLSSNCSSSRPPIKSLPKLKDVCDNLSVWRESSKELKNATGVPQIEFGINGMTLLFHSDRDVGLASEVKKRLKDCFGVDVPMEVDGYGRGGVLITISYNND